MNVLIIDYGMGNLLSVQRAVELCGAEPIIAKSPAEVSMVEKIILPGVGAFKDGMQCLIASGWKDFLINSIPLNKFSLLGICLGMQLLADTGHESGTEAGLGLIPGEVQLLIPNNAVDRIPHVGWNEVNQSRQSNLFNNIRNKEDFYFVHSYQFKPLHPEHILATTPYCGEFVSAVSKDNVWGVQFHPEKSSKAGMQLLKNFLMS